MKKYTFSLTTTLIMSMMVTAQVSVTSLAGSIPGYANGIGVSAQFSNPNGVATDTEGNVYVADTSNSKIRKITPAGIVSTLAGSTQGFADGAGATAKFSNPIGVATDAAGNVYVADTYNSKIRKITPDGMVSTIAGSTQGFADGIGDVARFALPYRIAIDAADNIYVADTGNYKIRKITPAGMVSTTAGSTQGFADGIGSAARFSGVQGIAVDTDGNVYVTDSSNYKIRKITPDGMVSTLAGSTQGFADGIGTQAQFYSPQGVTTDVSGNVYVADSNNYKIRKITPTGLVTTIAGSTVGFADGIGGVAQFIYPTGLATDAVGNLYVADYGNHKIRKITQQLDVVQNNMASKIVIFPNPVTNVLTLQLENSCIIDRISISDFSGKIILTQTQNTTEINIENLAQGIYILEVYSLEEKYTRKFVKE